MEWLCEPDAWAFRFLLKTFWQLQWRVDLGLGMGIWSIRRPLTAAVQRGTQPATHDFGCESTWYVWCYTSAMGDQDHQIDRLDVLSRLLQEKSTESINTSVRVPAPLHEAARIATGLGMSASTSSLTVEALRSALGAFVQRAALDQHYREFPAARPSVTEVALALAEMTGDPLAEQPELITQAAQVAAHRSEDPAARDVLLIATGITHANQAA